MIESILIGLLFILLYVIILAIVVYIILYVLGILGIVLPDPIPRLIWAAVAIVALIMIISVVLGGWNPRFRVWVESDRSVATLSTGAAAYL